MWYSVGFVSSSSDLVGMSVFLQESATPSLGSPEAVFDLVLTLVLSRLEDKSTPSSVPSDFAKLCISSSIWNFSVD